MAKITNTDSFAISIDGTVTQGGTIEASVTGDAPVVGGPYGREDGGWVDVVEEALENGIVYGRKDAAWESVEVATEPYVLVVEIEADLGTPDGSGYYDLPPGVTMMKGVDAGGQMVLQLTPGRRIRVPRGSSAVAGGRGGVALIAVDAICAFSVEGGVVSDINIINLGGPDILVLGAPAGPTIGSSLVDRVTCLGGGVKLAAIGFDITQLTDVSCLSDNGALVGFEVLPGALHGAVSLVRCAALNTSAGNVPNWTAFKIGAGATIAGGFSIELSVLQNLALQTGNVGLEIDPAAVVPIQVYRTNTIADFDTAGSTPLIGTSVENVTSVWLSNRKVPNTSPTGQSQLDAPDAPPTTNITVALTWYVLNVPGAILGIRSSLFDQPVSGQLQLLWEGDSVPVSIIAVVGLQKVGGGNVQARVRVVKSTDGGAVWNQVGVQSVADITAVASQITIIETDELNAGDRLRVEVTSSSSIVVVECVTLQFNTFSQL